MKSAQNLLTLVLSVCFIQTATAALTGTDDGQENDYPIPPEVQVKDILIEQQAFYTISPGNTQTNSQPAAATRPVGIWVNHQDNTYLFGQNIVISAKAGRDGYLTLVDVGTSGKVRQLFPNKYQRNNYLRKGQVIKIPGKNANFRYTVVGPAGTELIKAFLTDKPLNIYGKSAASFDNDIFPQSSSDAATLRKDILTTLNSAQAGRWAVYNKVIKILPSSGPGAGSAISAPVPVGVNTAAQAERNLHLNAAQIRDIQRFLRSGGYYAGKIDGAIGAQTRQAIRAWQRAQGRSPTGYINATEFALIMR